MHGLPISLQLVGRRLEEEKVLAMTRQVLRAIHPGKTEDFASEYQGLRFSAVRGAVKFKVKSEAGK